MCGIVGIVDFTKEFKAASKSEGIMKNGLIADTVRGPDSTGIVTVPKVFTKKDRVKTYKKAVNGATFIEEEGADFLSSFHEQRFIIGHNRWATTGFIDEASAHPFSKEHIHMVHNGTLFGWKALSRDYHGLVDSEAICWSLAENENPVTTLEKLNGAFALVWYNTKTSTLYMTRNEERPLYMVKVRDKDFFVYGSELKMLQWILDRNGCGVEKIYTLAPHKLYKIKDSMGAVSIEKYKKYAYQRPPYEYGDGYGGKYNSANWYNKDLRNKETPIGSPPANNVTNIRRKNITETSVSLERNTYHSKGDKIQFYFNKMEFKKPRSKHGVLLGTSIAIPYYRIEVQGVPRNEHTGKFILQGTIIDMVQYNDGGRPVLRVHKLTKTKIKDEMYALTSRSRGKIKEEEVPAVEQNITKKTMLQWKENMERLVADGCARCCAELEEPDYTELVFTQDNKPICKPCQLEISATKL